MEGLVTLIPVVTDAICCLLQLCSYASDLGAKNQARVEPEDGKCPAWGKFAEVRGQARASGVDSPIKPAHESAQENEESGTDRVSRWQPASSNPLWDRELDG